MSVLSGGAGQIIDRLEKGYYDALLSSCDSVSKQSLKLRDLEMHQASASQYVTMCIKLVDEIQSYVKLKKEYLIPYLSSLFAKDAEGHDCSNCSGPGMCSLQHELQYRELSESHQHLKEILNRLQMAALPLYSETIYPDAYRMLRNHMALIENKLTDLFAYEGAVLAPRVAEAQKNIHVRS